MRGGIQPRRAALSSRARASFRRDALGRVVERDECVLSGDVVTSRYEVEHGVRPHSAFKMCPGRLE